MPRQRPFTKEEFDAIYSRVPRLTVEVVIADDELGVLLGLRDEEPCKGTWNIPGGTVFFAEPLVEAAKRVAEEELGLTVAPGELMGYIEYPSHYNSGLDSPVGIAFRCEVVGPLPAPGSQPERFEWFKVLPPDMHEEQRVFLAERFGLSSAAPTAR